MGLQVTTKEVEVLLSMKLLSRGGKHEVPHDSISITIWRATIRL